MSSPGKRRFHFSRLQKIALGFVAAVLLMLLRSAVTYRNTVNYLTLAGRGTRLHQLLDAHDTMLRDLAEAESAERGYVITGSSEYLSACTASSSAVARDLETLKILTGGHPPSRELVRQVEPLVQRKLAVMKDNITARQQPGGDEMARELYAQSGDGELTEEIREKIVASKNDERKLLDANNLEFEREVKSALELVIIGSVGGVIFLGTALWWVARDILRRRKVEEELAEDRNLLSVLIETIPHQVYVKDVEGRYVMDNASHREHLGISDMNEVNGTRTTDYFPPELARGYLESDNKVLHLQEPVLDLEEPGMDREGNLVWLSTTKMPLYDTDGAVVGLVGLSEDITERKHAEERLRHYAEQMEKSNKELEEFASIASHDLQEPLRKIMAFGHRLKTTCGDALGEQGKDYLERMQNAAERMRTLINDLLTLSRVTSMARPFKQVDLIQIAKDVVTDLEVHIEQTSAEVEVGFLPEIEADPLQMRQLFQNLISNALKFHRKGERPIISISGKIVEMKDYQLPGVVPGDEACRIMVKDNGIGFSKEYAEKIFALFQRLHGRSEYEGTGIGLAVCRKITDRHGGSIVAKSSEGDGATFIITLPVIQNQNTDQEP